MTNGKVDICLNGGANDSGLISGGRQSKTLSGCEAADDRDSWDAFKHLVPDEEIRFNASLNLITANEESDTVNLTICVEDTGIKIPLCAQDRVSTPFMQADSCISRHYGGTGIGLSISKCLVELMGGQIDFVSRPQVGSTFSVTAVVRRCRKNALNKIEKRNYEDLPSSFRGLKAIVVDGKPVRAAVTKYHLKRLGILADVASSLKVAAGTCGRNGSITSPSKIQPDIVLVEKDSWYW